ncbi:MAG: hypothetical protein ACK476_03995 [Fluviicola sp.]
MKIFLSIFFILSFNVFINAQDITFKQTEQFFGVEMVNDKKIVIGGYMNIIDSSHIQIEFDLGENWIVYDSISTYLELDSTSINDIYFLYDKYLKDSVPCLVFRNSEGFTFYLSKQKVISTYIGNEKICYFPKWAQVYLPRNRKNKYSSLPVMFNK